MAIPFPVILRPFSVILRELFFVILREVAGPIDSCVFRASLGVWVLRLRFASRRMTWRVGGEACSLFLALGGHPTLLLSCCASVAVSIRWSLLLASLRVWVRRLRFAPPRMTDPLFVILPKAETRSAVRRVATGSRVEDATFSDALRALSSLCDARFARFWVLTFGQNDRDKVAE